MSTGKAGQRAFFCWVRLPDMSTVLTSKLSSWRRLRRASLPFIFGISWPGGAGLTSGWGWGSNWRLGSEL
jgi:hypothetical protein